MLICIDYSFIQEDTSSQGVMLQTSDIIETYQHLNFHEPCDMRGVGTGCNPRKAIILTIKLLQRCMTSSMENCVHYIVDVNRHLHSLPLTRQEELSRGLFCNKV